MGSARKERVQTRKRRNQEMHFSNRVCMEEIGSGEDLFPFFLATHLNVDDVLTKVSTFPPIFDHFIKTNGTGAVHEGFAFGGRPMGASQSSRSSSPSTAPTRRRSDGTIIVVGRCTARCTRRRSKASAVDG